VTVRLLETENTLILKTGLYINPGEEKLVEYALKELQN
jgi:hypothetical protein